ncbi:MAG: hypothetical protein D3917_19100, partial [Candidatus Electrothrix sp. AX5]|nr:hypothetical protein [Candidatus Electrothrix sp. AX5]
PARKRKNCSFSSAPASLAAQQRPLGVRNISYAKQSKIIEQSGTVKNAYGFVTNSKKCITCV